MSLQATKNRSFYFSGCLELNNVRGAFISLSSGGCASEGDERMIPAVLCDRRPMPFDLVGLRTKEFSFHFVPDACFLFDIILFCDQTMLLVTIRSTMCEFVLFFFTLINRRPNVLPLNENFAITRVVPLYLDYDLSI